MFVATVDTPIGTMTVVQSEVGVRVVTFEAVELQADWEPVASLPATRQLQAYFAGTLTEFDLPLDAEGTPFQRQVWSVLSKIPHGQTRTYGELAQQLELKNGSRAVGSANGRNPIAIIVPCHRVIGANGALTGYAGGLDRKRFLLDLESAALPLFPTA